MLPLTTTYGSSDNILSCYLKKYFSFVLLDTRPFFTYANLLLIRDFNFCPSSQLTPGKIPTMPQGTVKWFNTEKGFGFIKQDDGGGDLFVHHSETRGLTLDDGDPVEFEIGEGKKGPCAINVKKIN